MFANSITMLTWIYIMKTQTHCEFCELTVNNLKRFKESFIEVFLDFLFFYHF